MFSLELFHCHYILCIAAALKKAEIILPPKNDIDETPSIRPRICIWITVCITKEELILITDTNLHRNTVSVKCFHLDQTEIFTSLHTQTKVCLSFTCTYLDYSQKEVRKGQQCQNLPIHLFLNESWIFKHLRKPQQNDNKRLHGWDLVGQTSTTSAFLSMSALCTKEDLLSSEFVIDCLWKQEKKKKGKHTLSSKRPSCSYICPLLLSFRGKDQLFNTTWSKLVEVKMLRSLLFKVTDCFNMKVLEKMFAALSFLSNGLSLDLSDTLCEYKQWPIRHANHKRTHARTRTQLFL